MVGALTWRRELFRLGRRRAFCPRSGELLKSARGVKELVAVDVRVPRHGR
jgi:hypothetical protein